MKKITTLHQRVAKDATKGLTFHITAAHIAAAKCKDPSQCVIAQAVMDRFGDHFDGIEVGATITKVYTRGLETRYSTPSKLRKALIVFDKTGKWDLPEGEYTLLPPSKTAKLGARPNRWKRVSVKKGKPGRDMFRGAPLPTRKVKRVASMIEV